MSTMLTSAEATVDSRSRPLTIVANLLPPETIEARTTRKVRRIVIACLAGFVLLLGGWYAFATYELSLARTDLANAESDAHRLKAQQNQYNELIRTQTQSKAVQADLAKLFADEVQWTLLINAVGEVAPPGVEQTSVTAGIAGATTATGAAAAGAPASSGAATTTADGKRIIGRITVEGKAPTKPAVASYLDAVAKLDGVANPLATTINAETNTAGPVTFSLQIDLTADALGGRFKAPGGK
jgi:hypothetical protein